MSAAATPVRSEVRTWADAEAFIEAVLAGEIVVGELQRLAVERHVRDLETGAKRGLHFDVQAADDRLEFNAMCKHAKSSFATRARSTFVPEPWQCFVLGSVYGWKRADGTRRFTLAYVEVAKKNGKTFMMATEGLYATGFDGEEGAETYSIATKEDQARLSWQPAERMIALSSELQRYFEASKKQIYDGESGSLWKPLGADSKTADGPNPSRLIADELHAHPSGALFNNMHLSMGARRQPLTWATTTAGESRTSFCWSVRKTCEHILKQTKHDDTVFAFIACLDEGDDWRDERVWPKANPNWGVSVNPETMRAERDKAVQNPRLENDFRRYKCNEWISQVTRWFALAKWDACSAVPAGDLEAAAEWRDQMRIELAGKRCFGGLDVGRTTDLTAAAALFPPWETGRDQWVLLVQGYLPEDKIDGESSEGDHVPYRVWADQGFVTVFAGAATTSPELYPAVKEFFAPFEVIKCAYDVGAGARDVAVMLMHDGMEMLEWSQAGVKMSPGTKKLESMVMASSPEIDHGGNPLLRWAIETVSIKSDTNENIRPSKSFSTGRIDPLVAAIDAIGVAIASDAQDTGPTAWVLS